MSALKGDGSGSKTFTLMPFRMATGPFPWRRLSVAPSNTLIRGQAMRALHSPCGGRRLAPRTVITSPPELLHLLLTSSFKPTSQSEASPASRPLLPTGYRPYCRHKSYDWEGVGHGVQFAGAVGDLSLQACVAIPPTAKGIRLIMDLRLLSCGSGRSRKLTDWQQETMQSAPIFLRGSLVDVADSCRHSKTEGERF